MNELISVVIPMYNSEKTVERCLQSVINQTYSNIEIILVDNGSTDNTVNIAKKYSLECDRIHLLYEKNKGVSNARNRGIEQAKGSYLTFVDADDYLELDGIEKEVEMANNVESDVTFFDYYMVIGGKASKPKEDKRYGLYIGEKKDLICKNMCEELFFASVWRALYKTDLIKGIICFKPIKYSEDLLFNIEVIKKAKSVYVCESTFYYYVDNEMSALKTLQYDLQNTINLIEEMYKTYLKEPDEDMEKLFIIIADKGCLRILNGTLGYSKFKKWISKIEIKASTDNKLIRNIIERKIFRLYITYWMIKIKNKIKGANV